MRVISVNVNGLRAAISKGFLEWMRRQEADAICLQEIRATEEQLPRRATHPKGYFATLHPAEKKGYSGTAIYTKQKPDRVIRSLDWPEWDQEGRYLQVDLGPLSIVSVYVPSGSSSDARQAAKWKSLARFQKELKKIQKSGRDYILCGDWNIAHKEIDLKNWRSNRKNSGFLPEERAWMDKLFGPLGFVDAFRVVDPRPDRYTWWSNRGRAWEKNVGWRLDYQVVTSGLKERVESASIYTRKRFSDHAPLTIDYRLPR